MSEQSVAREELAAGRVPDATVDEVGTPGVNQGFDGHPIRSRTTNGYGTSDPNSPSWAGWGV